MKLILHGQLKELYGESVDFQSESVAEALEGFSRQMPNFPKGLLVEAVGFGTEDQLRAPTDAKAVHIIPAMYGGGGKFAGIILGTLMVVAGVILMATPGGQAFGTSLIVAGGTMIAMGVINLFMKAPTISKANDPAASKYLGVNKNTTATGTPITLAWGIVPIAGHWLSIQANANNLARGTFPVTPT